MDRHWFPAILVGFSVLLGLIFIAALSPQGRNLLERNLDVRQVTASSSRITEESYESALSSLLSEYQVTGDAQTTYDALIVFRVPGSMLSLHYELVIAFQKLLADRVDEAEARFTALKAQYPWLPL